MVYFHNLKFDGAFVLDYYLTQRKFEIALDTSDKSHPSWVENKFMKSKQIKCLISDRGQWYTITLKIKGGFIEIRDSLKLIPMSIAAIGKSFGTKHRKTEIEYAGYRQPYGVITPNEKEYLSNDLLVLKEALEIMFNDGHNRLTIGSCCFHEFKQTVDVGDYENFFPNLFDMQSPIGMSYGEYILKSYYGGWCYVAKPGIKYNGVTADVNSLYPSMMHSCSGNKYPIGKPKWFEKEIPEQAWKENQYFFVRFKCRFFLKPGYLPFQHIRKDCKYKSTENLETSDIRMPDGSYSEFYYDVEGGKKLAVVELTLTKTDFVLFFEHYNVTDFELLDGCMFYAVSGVFDEYIDKYMHIKQTSKGARRTEAKLFLNNLYGKMATSPDSSFKIPFVDEQQVVRYTPVDESDKKPGYIAIGSAITSYARNFTIRKAQLNYHGKDKPGFCYADTDSIHCDITADKLIGIDVHPTNMCCWKLESYWDVAKFVRQKTYIEHVTHEDGETVDPYYNIKCAGMTDSCKDLVDRALTGVIEKPGDTDNKIKFVNSLAAKEFFDSFKGLEDFKPGLKVPGKLSPKRLPGGIVLKEDVYTMKG